MSEACFREKEYWTKGPSSLLRHSRLYFRSCCCIRASERTQLRSDPLMMDKLPYTGRLDSTNRLVDDARLVPGTWTLAGGSPAIGAGDGGRDAGAFQRNSQDVQQQAPQNQQQEAR